MKCGGQVVISPFSVCRENYNMKCSVSILRGTLSSFSFFFSPLCKKVAVCKPLSQSSESILCFSTVWGAVMWNSVKRVTFSSCVNVLKLHKGWMTRNNLDLWPFFGGKQANQGFSWSDAEATNVKNEARRRINIKVCYLTKYLSHLSSLFSLHLSLSLPSCEAAHYLIKQKCHKNNLKNPSACQILTPAQLRCHHKSWSLWFFYRQYGKRWAKWLREMVASNVRKGEEKGKGARQMQSERQSVCV